MSFSLFYSHPDLESQANVLAKRFNFQLQGLSQPTDEAYEFLNLTVEGLMLHVSGMKPWKIDFLSAEKQHRRKYGGKETLVRACGIKKNQASLTILDLTAGLGNDAFVLACAGVHMILVERHPIVAALLEDALNRLLVHPELSQTLDLHLHFDNAEHFLLNYANCQSTLPDVIYLDPMHPQRQKTAHVKKEMKILQQWVPPETHPEHLLNLSLQYAQKRVVLKWPRKAPPVKTIIKPNFVYEENTVRFEVYLPRLYPPNNSI